MDEKDSQKEYKEKLKAWRRQQYQKMKAKLKESPMYTEWKARAKEQRREQYQKQKAQLKAAQAEEKKAKKSKIVQKKEPATLQDPWLLRAAFKLIKSDDSE